MIKAMRPSRSELKPVYLLWGGDPSERMAARQALQKNAFDQGITERTSYYVQNKEDIQRFFQSLRQGSLLSSTVFVEYNTDILTFEAKEAEVFEKYLENPAANKVLLLNARQLGKGQTKTRWYQLLQTVGMVQVLPSTKKPLDIFDLSRAIKRAKQTQDPRPALCMLDALCETTDPVLILWGIGHAEETRSPRWLWCAEETDLIIKGLKPGKVKDSLERLVLESCGKAMLC